MERKRKTKEEWIRSANRIHDNKYVYTKVNSYLSKQKIIVTCPIHGDFITTWDGHINGKNGCPKCSKCYKWNNEEWIEEVSRKFNNKYDYSKTVYTKAKEKVTIICHELDELGEEHGDFQIRAGNHMAGIGCPKCAGKYRPTTEEWIKRANKVHNNKYVYNKTKYTKSNEKVIITCPLHGDFIQEAMSHLMGCGCPKCNGGISYDKQLFIKKSEEIHKNEYDYSKFIYVNAHTKGIIICKRHGMFLQTPYQHMNGQGCPKCKSSKLEEIIMKLFDENNIQYICQYKIENTERSFRCDFYLPEYKIVVECQGEQHYIPTSFNINEIDESVKLDNFEKVRKSDIDKYNLCVNSGYKLIYFTIPNMFHIKNVDIYEGFYKDKITFTSTNKLLEYVLNQEKQTINNSFINFYNDIKKCVSPNIINYNNIIRYNNNIIIYKTLIPNKRTELNDLKRMYKKLGNNVIIIFEDEYIHNKNIVLSKIKHICKINTNKEKIQARKCIIKEIDKQTSKNFLEKNHIQGYVASTIYLGCFYKDNLIGVMTLKKETNTSNKWELTRLATDNNFVCNGVGGKLFKYFVKNYDFIEIKSFADKRWTNNENNIYIKLGFSCSSFSHPEYRYIDVINNTRCHKFGFRKQILIKKYPNENLSIDMAEREMTEKLGFYPIWDCGLIKYVYTNPNFKEE